LAIDQFRSPSQNPIALGAAEGVAEWAPNALERNQYQRANDEADNPGRDRTDSPSGHSAESWQNLLRRTCQVFDRVPDRA
jgi:hypothetical protein